ncbi:MAG: phosphomannomutase/phosphoglucomutase, partial [Candidatus Sedimenticola sp. 6PFRAG1]
PVAAGGSLPKSIFLAYDIRGVVGETLTPDVVFELGRAIGSEAYDRGQQTVIVGRDGRDSGEELSEALCRGLMDSGRDVVRIGVVPTPLLYFATHFLGSNTGVMITGSHNPVEYNGLKIVVGGEALEGDSIQALGQRIESGNLLQGNGMEQEQELIQDYIARVTEDVQLARPLKVVVDSGNGSAGLVAPDLLRALGCDVIELFSEIDGSFPNHHPDPSKPENLQTLITMVRERKADIGVAFDGDGDRLGVVDSDGKIIWPDRLLMLFARDVLARQPGSDVIFDVKSTRHLATEVLGYGGRPIMWKTGHSPIKAKMKETGALLAGEMSGHIFFRERWYGFDDGVYSCAR